MQRTLGDLTCIENQIQVAIGCPICEVTGIRNCIPIAIAQASIGKLTTVENSIGITVWGQSLGNLAQVHDTVEVTIDCQSRQNFTTVNLTVAIAIGCSTRCDLTSIGDPVVVAVVHPSCNVTAVRHPVSVTIGLTLIGDLVVVTIHARTGHYIAGIRNSVEIAILLCSRIDFTTVIDSVSITVRRNFYPVHSGDVGR